MVLNLPCRLEKCGVHGIVYIIHTLQTLQVYTLSRSDSIKNSESVTAYRHLLVTVTANKHLLCISSLLTYVHAHHM